MKSEPLNTEPRLNVFEESWGDSIDERLLTVEDSQVEADLKADGECHDPCEDFSALAQDLRELPIVPFPKATLEDLFAHTVDADGIANASSHSRWSIQALAKAAVVLLAFSISWISWNQYDVARKAEVNRSVLQVRYVVATTARALHRVEEAAVVDILMSRLAEPLHRISSQWLEQIQQTKGRLGT